MNSGFAFIPIPRERRFSLWSLLELFTISAVLFALCPLVGIAASVTLIGMSVAILVRQGWMALSMLMASLMATDLLHHPQNDGSDYGRQLLVVLIAAGLCTWLRISRRQADRGLDHREYADPFNSRTLVL